MKVAICSFIALILLALPANSTGQVLAKKDLYRFVGAFFIDETEAETIINLHGFSKWFLDTENRDSVRYMSKQKVVDPNFHWVYYFDRGFKAGTSIHRNQNAEIDFHIMTDIRGHETKRNVMTVWTPVGVDSLAFVCAQAGEMFETNIGAAAVEIVAVFPDSSYVVMLRRTGEGYDSYEFLASKDACSLVRFYERYWDMPSTDWSGRSEAQEFMTYSYDLDSLKALYYRFTETQNYQTFRDVPGTYGGDISLDSTRSQTIDLWQIAQDSLGLR